MQPTLEQYLNIRNGEGRLSLLRSMRENSEFKPVELVDDLLCLNLPLKEQAALIKTVNSSNKLNLECFFLTKLFNYHQDIAVSSFHSWIDRTDRLLWYKLIEIAYISHLPQRLRYRMIQMLPKVGGSPLLRAFINVPGLEDFSAAFHGIFIQRALEWGIEHPRITKLAEIIAETTGTAEQANDKGIPSALSYLARFSPKMLIKLHDGTCLSESWRPLITTVLQNLNSKFDVDSFDKNLGDSKAKINDFWPLIWHRHLLKKDVITRALERIAKEPSNYDRWHYFAGFDRDMLLQAVCSISDPDLFVESTNLVESLIETPAPAVLIETAKSLLTSSKDPAKFLANLEPKLRSQLIHSDPNAPEDTNYNKIIHEQTKVLNKIENIDPDSKVYFPTFNSDSSKLEDWENDEDNTIRRRFFNLAYRKASEKPAKDLKENYWNELIRAWNSPSKKQLDLITNLARQAPILFQVCYIDTLSRFKGENEAALKLLDYIRTDQELELKAVLYALHGIGTSRAAMEIISCITRPNISLNLQMDCCALLQDMDLSGLQDELRSAIDDLKPSPDTTDGLWEVKENLTTLLKIDKEKPKKTAPQNDTSKDHDLDELLIEKIPQFKKMSSEVRRALRTAQFFDIQVNQAQNQSTIDLSPVIDMQYKALELFFRELFEQDCKDLIHQGVLQRKLDVIGYARPIEPQMAEFETFIGKLPIINTIPFFSKFKLRKMLRAICQFRPGKRFTLDGLKAFGLFFLCFGRKQCPYGLEQAFPLPFSIDSDLFEFCKKLHMFQDFRNRAAHEGFQPDESNNIEAIWELTAEIVEKAFTIQEFLQENKEKIVAESVRGFSSKNDHVKIVHKKVS